MLRKILSTEHTEGTDHREFLVASLEILEEIFLKNGREPEMITMLLDFGSCFARNEIPMKYNLKTKSLLECARIPRFCEGALWGSPTARNLNENL